MTLDKKFGAVDEVSITILVNNHADLIVKSTDSIKYYKEKALLAEHGFSALIHFPGNDLKILWDAGISNIALMENIKRMEIDPKSINKIALSHGHRDHYAALSDFIKAMALEIESKEWDEPITANVVDEWKTARQVPITAHPATFRERWWVKDDGTRVGPLPIPPRIEWEAFGAKLVLTSDPYQLTSGCWTTGYIPRDSFETSGRPTQLLYREGDEFYPDDLEEDQAIIINVKQKGLVVLSGCAHAGIVNTTNQARKISGVDKVYAIIGGFHLARSNDEEINQTMEAIQDFNPEILVPCHCTGFPAMCAIAHQFPESFHHGVVGATYLL